MSRKKTKPWTEMNVEELQKATAEFDQEFVADTFSEPTPQDKQRWKKVKRKRGRPVRGEGTVRISVSIEKSILRRTDQLADKTGQTRSKLIERGLKKVLGKTGS